MDYRKHKSNESIEDYLETIFLLEKKLGNVRSIDIANEMNFTKPSVSVAMKNLRELGYITVSENTFIILTDEGRIRAADVYERHILLSNWLISLGVNEDVAREDACRLVHDISSESFSAIKSYIDKVSKDSK